MSAFGGSSNKDALFPRIKVVASAAVNPASLIDAAGEDIDVTVTGAAVGDFVMFAPGVDMQGITMTAHVSAANTVTIRLQNESGGTLDIASSTWNFLIIDGSSGVSKPF